MPEEIVRSYLENPFLYADSTFCTGCSDYFPGAELHWIDTGECLADYTKRLQRSYLERYGIPPCSARH